MCTFPIKIRNVPARVLLAMLIVTSAGCPGSPAAEPLRDYPGLLRAPAAYPGDFFIDHRVTATHAERSESFRAILEKRGNTLRMVGLGPHGGRAFVLTQEGEAIRFESQLPRALPFPPRYMLLDVHRVWLLGIPRAPLPDGEHRAELEGEEVVEVWADGRLFSRSFRRLDARPPGWIRIAYEGGLSPDPATGAPSRIELENGWFGYRLLIENATRTAFDGTMP